MGIVLAGLVKILGSAGFGTVFGGVMGYFNRKADLKFKELEFKNQALQREHELKQRELDAKVLQAEYEGRVQVAETEGSFKALEKSYDFAQPDKGSKMAAFSSFIRPFISLCYFSVTSLGAAWILYYAFLVKDVTFSEIQWYELVMFVIDWTTFMASTCIGWWYSMRAGAAPKR